MDIRAAEISSILKKQIKDFGKEAEVLNRKAYKAYKFLRDDKSSYQELYDLLGYGGKVDTPVG